MGSSARKRQTFAKMTRERAVKEKRALKQEKKEERKRLAAEAREAEALGLPVPSPDGEGEEPEAADEEPSADASPADRT